MDEAFARSQKDIHVVDLFVEAPAGTDTVKYSKAINEVSQALKSNKSIKETLEKVNTNGVNVVANDFGFITVFTLPYEFENIVYGLKPVQSSAPYRTKKGWHIFKNIEERHAVGKIKLAQILLTAPAGFIDERAKTKRLADSIYNELKHGADFGAMAKEFSNDRATYFNGGEMPEFGVAKYNPAFEKAAFSLTKDNEISQPFETEFGFHIIKRIAATPVPSSKNEEAFMYNLKQEVLKDSRIESTKQQFIKEILPKIGYKKIEINEPDLWEISDSSLMANKNITSVNLNEKTILLSYNDHSKIKVSDWILFLRNSGKVVPGQMHQSYTTLWPEFISFSAV
jgi:peptidyl-prolyl cis-trans isomerase SurA